MTFAGKRVSYAGLRGDAVYGIDMAVVATTISGTQMNTNLVHNILNMLGLLVGSMLMFDWTQLGLSATTAGTIGAVFILADKVIKLGINIVRDGITGLVKDQPPVK